VLGTEQAITGYTRVLGSATALCVVALARLGLRTALIARVGDDEPGQFCRECLRAEGVNVMGVITDPSTPTGLTVSLAYPADRLLLTHSGTMALLTGADVPAERLGEARHLHVSSFFLQTGLQADLPALFAAARAQGLTTSLDTGWDPEGAWMSDALRDTLAQTDVFLPNKAELAALGDADALLATGVSRIVVKQGAAGATLFTPEGATAAPGFQVHPTDTTGAGDSFNGGFLFGFLAGWPAAKCLRLGNACGAMATRIVGGVGGYSDRAAVEAFMLRPASP